MTTVWYRRCDQCNAERRSHLCVGWWRLLPDTEDSGDEATDMYDFCSIACLETWTMSRHLGTGPRNVRQTRGVHHGDMIDRPFTEAPR